jgi:argininosuccinate lyase
MSGVSVIGNVNADIVTRSVTDLPPPGGDLIVDTIELRVGGAAANAALALARLGLIPRLFGAVGDDVVGRFVVERLAAERIDGGVLVLGGQSTGISICLEGPGRDRSFITMRGTLDRFDASMVPPEALASAYVLVCGYFSLRALRGAPALGLLVQARKAGAKVLLDPDVDPDGWPASSRTEIEDVLPLVDAFLPNEHEARGLTGLDDPLEAGRALQRRSGRWVVVKLGSDGCVAIGPDDRVLRVPAPKVKALDTTGAGDSFDAAVIFALSRGEDWPSALSFATRVASAVVARPSEDRHPSLADIPARWPV